MTFFPAHGECALGKANGDNHGQHLRGQAYATAIAKKNAPFQSCLVNPLMKKTRGTMTAMS